MATFTPRSRATIRDTILTNWQAKYRAIGLDLLIIKGSDAYMQADIFALEIEGLEAQAAQNRNEILPDKASSAGLLRHGYVDGIDKEPATNARFVVRGTCTPSATLNLAGKVVQSTGGIIYTPESSSVTDSNGDGFYEVTVKANITGTDGNLPVGAVLQWSQTPVNATSGSVTVLSITATAVDEEDDAAYATRIIQRRQERPGSGNRADWADWGTQPDGVSECFVFPGLHWTLGAGAGFQLGCLTLMPMGPAQGDSTTNTRILSSGRRAEIKGYIEGTHDASGATTLVGEQLRPASFASENYFVEAPTTVTQDVIMSIKLANGYKNTVVLVTAGAAFNVAYVDVANNASSWLNERIRVWVGTTHYRGGYAIRTIASAVYSSGPNTTRLTFDTPVVATPSNDADGKCVYPAPANENEIRLAVFDLFDKISPSTNFGVQERYPTEENVPSVLYRSHTFDQLIPTYDTRRRLVNGVEGVINVTILVPVGDVSQDVTKLTELGYLRILQA